MTREEALLREITEGSSTIDPGACIALIHATILWHLEIAPRECSHLSVSLDLIQQAFDSLAQYGHDDVDAQWARRT